MLRDVQVTTTATPKNVELKLTRGHVLTGRLADLRTGLPVSGHRVNCKSSEIQSLRLADDTDAQGKFHFRLLSGTYDIETRTWEDGEPSILSQTIDAAHTVGSLEWKIGTRPMLKGRLLDPQGQPIAGEVIVDRLTETLPDGSFSMAKPDHRSHRGSSAPALAFNHDRTLGRAFVWKVNGADEAVDIRLDRVAGLTGRVLTKTGASIGDAEIHVVIGQYAKHLSCFGGRYGRDGRLSLKTVPTGLPLRVFVRRKGYKFYSSKQLTLEPGEYRELPDIVMRRDPNVPAEPAPTGAITGRVVDERDRPVVGAYVSPSGMARDTRAITDMHGRFELKGLPLGWEGRLTAQRSGAIVRHDGAAEGQRDIVIRLLPTGYDLIGTPAPKLRVREWFNCDPVTLADFKGKVVALGVNCYAKSHMADKPAQQLQALHDRYADKGLVVIGVLRPISSRPFIPKREDVQDFVTRNRARFRVAIDQAVPHPHVGRKQGTPYYAGITEERYAAQKPGTIFLIDRDGIICGAPGRAELEAKVVELLNDK